MAIELKDKDEISLDDYGGRVGRNSVFGQMIIGEEVTQFASLFAYPSNTRKLKVTTENGATATNADSMLVLNSGTNVAGRVWASSKRALQYVPGKEAYCKFTAIFTANILNNIQMIGLFDDLNGFAVGMKNGEFAIFRKKNGVIVETVTQLHFNGDTLTGNENSKCVIDVEKGNVFAIRFGFLGFANINFEIMGNDGRWICFHTIKYAGSNTTPHISLPYLKIGAEVINAGNTVNATLKTASVEAGVVDGTGLTASTRDFTRSTGATYTAGNNQRYVVYHSKPTYGGVQNRVECLLNMISGSIDGTKIFTWDLYKLSAIPTGGTWVDNSPNGVMEVSYDTVINLTGAEKILPKQQGKSSDFFEIVESLNIRLLPDEYWAFVYSTTGAGDLSLGTRWKELF
jgi:hypothetical protein